MVIPMDTRTFEDNRWPTYYQGVEFRHRAALSLINSASVLDIGPGDGLFLTMVRDKFQNDTELAGADISIEAVKRCKERGIEAHHIESAEHLPFESKSFDTVVLLDVLEHTYQPELLLREAARVARTFVIVGVPNFSSLPARIQTLRGRVPENNEADKGHIYWFNRNTLEKVVRETRLTPVAWKMNVQRPFVSFQNLLTRIFPNLFPLSFVVKLKKAE